MTHDEFIEALTAETAWTAGGLRAPDDALAHARDCTACRRVLDALARIAAEDDAETSVPDGYWRDFDARLAPRLAARPTARRMRRVGSRRFAGAWLAAAAAIAGLLAVAAWKHVRTPPAPSVATASAQPADIIAAASSDELAAAVAALGVAVDADPIAAEAPPADLTFSATLDAAGEFADPVAALEAELIGALDEAAQIELARRLHEASS